LFGKAPATLLDQLATAAAAGGELNAVQKWIEKALDQPVKYPEIIYWLWKGPAKVEGLRLPEDNLLFDELIGTALALGRTLEASAAETREFRQRIRQALGLRGGAKAERLVAATPFDKAVTLKSQLLRLEGFGENVRNDLLNVLRDTHPQLWVKAAAKRLEPWQRDDVLFATAAGVERRTAERDQIVNVDMRENAKRIGEAAALGDLSENSEYKFALEERDLLRARLADINGELSIAEALQPDDVPSDHVGIGSRVVFREKETGETRTVTFLGPFDTDVEAGVYNYKAPFSQKVLGLRIGESGTVTLDGKDLELEVVSIENALRSE
jgi:transcription elongation GreA/GreB family factor